MGSVFFTLIVIRKSPGRRFRPLDPPGTYRKRRFFPPIPAGSALFRPEPHGKNTENGSSIPVWKAPYRDPFCFTKIRYTRSSRKNPVSSAEPIIKLLVSYLEWLGNHTYPSGMKPGTDRFQPKQSTANNRNARKITEHEQMNPEKNTHVRFR